MAPIGEAYFPPLDRCFSGKHQLWSWESCYTALSQSQGVPEDESLRRFLTDPHTIELLLHPLAPYPQPNSQSKSSFETKTSAINVTPASHARYDINEIKDQSVWLSEQTKVDEVSALRIAVLEWQTRPTERLLQGRPTGVLEDDPETSLNVIKSAQFQSDADSAVVGQRALEHDAKTLSEKGSRRLRLIKLLLSERRYVLKCSEYILSYVVYTLEDSKNGRKSRNDALRLPWFKEIGLDLLSKWTPEKPTTTKRVGQNPKFLNEAISEVRSKIEALGSGSGWSVPEAGQDFEVIWGCNQAIELIHILQIIETLLQSTNCVLQAAVVVPWFRLMGECGFLEGFELPYPGFETAYTQPLQSLAALISLTLLNVPAVLDLLNQASTASLSAPSPSESTPYIFDQPATNEVNDILIFTSTISVASPTILAWSIIAQNLREIALAAKDSREVRQSIRAADKYGGPDSSDTDGSERPVTRSLSAIRRRSSTSSDTSQQSTLLEEIYDSICITAVDDDPIAYLAKNAVEGGTVFDIIIAIATQYCTPYAFEHHGAVSRKLRLSLLHLIQISVEYLEYQPGLISAIIAIITGSKRYWDLLDEPSLSTSNDLAILLRKDEALNRRILLVALSRFPYEATPLLQLCAALASQDNSHGFESEVSVSLQKLDYFTCALPLSYQGYTNIREDEESDFVELTEDYIVDLMAVTEGNPSNYKNVSALLQSSKLLTSSSTYVIIPRGTQGQVLSNNKPLVVAWNHDYSGIAYIGKVLRSASSSNTSAEPSKTTVSPNLTGEAVGLITNILLSIYKCSAREHKLLAMRKSASSILDQANEELDEDDIVSIIFRIFENELYKPGELAGGGNLDLLVQCIQFTHATLLVMPDRVWPFLGKSGLFGADGNGGRLSLLVSSYEMVTGHYDFLLGCVRLYDALIEDIMENAITRNVPTKAITRFDAFNQLGTGVSKSTMENVLLSIQRNMIDVFSSLRSWKFADENDRAEMACWLCTIFERLLVYCFGTHSGSDHPSRLTGTLLPVASVVLDVFLSTSKTDLVIDPLLQMCSEGLTIAYTSLPSRGQWNGIRRTANALRLISALIAAGDGLGRDSTHLQKHLFENAGVIVSLYATHEAFKLPAINLLTALVRSSSFVTQDPPSLLGHLGQGIAGSFLEVLSVLDRPVSNETLAIAIWTFLAAIVSSQQQWFAHFVLAGSTPRDTVKPHHNDTQTARMRSSGSMFDIALDGLCDIDSLEPRKALEMLRFVALAADFWPQMFITLDKHPRFLLSISEFASRQGSTSAVKSSHTLEAFCRIKMASHVADILALYAHWTQQEHKPKFVQELLKHLTHLAKHVISVPSYNASLHSNLRQNFSAKFPGIRITDFQRSTLGPSSLGETYFYDLALAQKMLRSDPSWTGKRSQGFADEIRRANLNLSLVEAQMALFHSWKTLLLELVAPLAAEGKFQKIIAHTTIDCLRANDENSLPGAFHERLARSRIDLAFALLDSLNRTRSTELEVNELLPVAWKTLRNHNTDIGTALTAEDSDYHRMLIRILYLALQVHASANTTSPADSWARTTSTSTALPLEIISVTVAQGFRSLTNLLHESPDLVSPSDFSMLIALFRSCIRVANVARNSEHLINAFSNSQTSRCASTLLSWSDQLAVSSSGDPIYGEVSICFLLELSTVPALAENLAVEGVLSYVLTTNLIQLLQNQGFGPFDNPPRMYAIWSRGILPLLLNLLHAVGPPIAAEVAAALNAFPQQLSRANQAFGASSHTTAKPKNLAVDAITLSMAQEANYLALIVKVLRTFREAGASAAVMSDQIEDVKWDATQVKDDIEGWLQRRGALRDRIVPNNAREEAWIKAKPDKEGAGENKLEEKILLELMGVVDIFGNSEG